MSNTDKLRSCIWETLDPIHGKVPVKAYFHSFGDILSQDNSGKDIVITVAIIECKDNGQVVTVAPKYIRFEE